MASHLQQRNGVIQEDICHTWTGGVAVLCADIRTYGNKTPTRDMFTGAVVDKAAVYGTFRLKRL